MAVPEVVRQAQIAAEFTGFDEDMLFHITDGTYWLQDEPKHWHFYAYRPVVEFLEFEGRLYLRLDGQQESVAVRQLQDVIESQIDGEFKGWEGNTEYRLANGQTWKQRSDNHTSRSADRPKVVVYKGESGWLMKVQGTTAKVEQV
jgi:hypothetical protein